MNVILSDISKKALKECKDALLRNDLGKVYNHLVDKLGELYSFEIGMITRFFESKEIYIENYLDYIPSFAFTGWNQKDFSRWTKKLNGSEDWVVVPPNIQELDIGAFSVVDIPKLALPDVKEIDECCFDRSNIKWLKLGKDVGLKENAFYDMDYLLMIDVPDEHLKRMIEQSRFNLGLDTDITINVVK